MTRREEITKASICQYQIIGTIGEQEAFKNGFVKGAEWADKTMIEKACDWIQCMVLDYIQGDITDIKWESMFADLRNYIENGDD